jgi:ATP-binding cassette subfamily B protein
MLIFFLPSAIVSAKRINQVLKLSSSIVSGKTKKINLKNKYAIEFTNVNFKVNSTSENILSNIDFKIKPGKTLAIIGATGSGKSMIAKLTARLFDSSKGTIKIYGRNIKEYDLNFLHETIGFAPQKAFLFNTTIHNNVLANIADRGYSAYLQDQIVKKACDIACASEFINKYEDKYNHIVSQNSTNLSGGQRQRIAIARAIAKEPNILIFDDSFSALDMLTDKKIRKNISNNYRKTTKIIIAQRINTIINADNIIVLDSGKIVGHGTHKSLMKSCKVYQEFAHSQLSRKELNNGK